MHKLNPVNPPAPIAWMAKNPVAANLIMIVLLIGGVMVLSDVKQEIEPDFEAGIVQISVAFPGASPNEVEKSILLAVEESINGIDGIKRVTAFARENSGLVYAELLNEAQVNRTMEEIKNHVDRITSFPADAERPLIRSIRTGKEVLGLIIHGNTEEKILRHLADSIRNDLLKEKNISKIELTGIRPLEISVEVPQAVLRKYDLTLEKVAQEIQRSTVELPGGEVKTSGGEILLRTMEKREKGREFENVIVLNTRDGGRIRLGDIAHIKDGFEEQDLGGFFNGQPSVWIRVYSVGEQKPLEVAETVKKYLGNLEGRLPPGINATVFFDLSETFHQQIDLLKQNGIYGLILVLFILGLILEMRLAFWVTMGIPISFLGAFMVMPQFDVSINSYSLFALIVTLGMVVDDAIIIGENIYYRRQNGEAPIEAAINGASEVAVPVVFSILTTVAAFSPMLFLPGVWGKFFRILPIVIISVLVLSLVESLLILPAHLAHLGESRKTGSMGLVNRFQQSVAALLDRFVDRIYGPLVKLAVGHQWPTVAIAVSLLIVCYGLVRGGRIDIEFFPKTESSLVTATTTLPFGVSVDETRKVQRRIEAAALRVKDKTGTKKETRLMKGVFTYYTGSNQIVTVASLTSLDERNMSATEFVDAWRTEIGDVPGLESLLLNANFSGPMRDAKDIDFELAHKDMDLLKQAAQDLAGYLKNFQGIHEIDDGFSASKPQLNFTLRPEAELLGITAESLGRQIRNAFLGAEALSRQRGRDAIKITVRLPKEERSSEYDIEELLVKTQYGGEVPLSRVANIQRGKSYDEITRVGGNRSVNVTAAVQKGVTNARKVIASIEQKEMPELLKRYPGLQYGFGFMERSGVETMEKLFQGFLIAVLAIYVLIAIPFRSYLQPFIVISAIPFGLVGAILGHMAMGFDLSLVSMMGLVALSGVVVNDSLVLIHTANRNLAAGMDRRQAVSEAGKRRFRPILLTSVTTFLGLTPMIFETSTSARYIIPMAISLGFGVLFATTIILLMVPAFFVVVEDLKRLILDLFRNGAKEPGRQLKAREVGADSD
ncbi:MAG: efflux RND transporter permease subunit [Proteobacteria bacterium]|nr:efflux RND transporter permease subunit [Pseudomonadota bacterium]